MFSLCICHRLAPSTLVSCLVFLPNEGKYLSLYIGIGRSGFLIMDEPLAQNLSAVMAAAAAALQKPAAHGFQGPGGQCKVFW